MISVTKKRSRALTARSLVLGYAWPALAAIAVLAVTIATVVGLTLHSSATADSAPPTDNARSVAAPIIPRPSCPEKSDGKAIVVGLASQHMVLCLDGQPVSDIAVTTGSVERGVGTPLGTWRIESHDVDRTLSGPGYTVFVHYWLHLFGDIGFHDSPWQKFPYGDTTAYKTRGSEGCIHVPGNEIKNLYDWAGDGTPVTITA